MKMCHEFEREQGGVYGRVWREEKVRGKHYLNKILFYYLKTLKSNKNKY